MRNLWVCMHVRLSAVFALYTRGCIYVGARVFVRVNVRDCASARCGATMFVHVCCKWGTEVHEASRRVASCSSGPKVKNFIILATQRMKKFDWCFNGACDDVADDLNERKKSMWSSCISNDAVILARVENVDDGDVGVNRPALMRLWRTNAKLQQLPSARCAWVCPSNSIASALLSTRVYHIYIHTTYSIFSPVSRHCPTSKKREKENGWISEWDRQIFARRNSTFNLRESTSRYRVMRFNFVSR